MFSREFEIILCIALAAITVLLFLGKGNFMLKTKDDLKTKKDPEDQKKFSRGLSYFTLAWFLAQLGVLLIPTARWVDITYIVVLVLTFAGMVIYSKKRTQ